MKFSAKIMLGFIKRDVEYRTCKAIVTLICVMQTTIVLKQLYLVLGAKYALAFLSLAFFEHMYVCGDGLVAKLSPTLCNPVGCSLGGSSVHGISQVRIPE